MRFWPGTTAGRGVERDGTEEQAESRRREWKESRETPQIRTASQLCASGTWMETTSSGTSGANRGPEWAWPFLTDDVTSIRLMESSGTFVNPSLSSDSRSDVELISSWIALHFLFFFFSCTERCLCCFWLFFFVHAEGTNPRLNLVPGGGSRCVPAPTRCPPSDLLLPVPSSNARVRGPEWPEERELRSRFTPNRNHVGEPRSFIRKFLSS